MVWFDQLRFEWSVGVPVDESPDGSDRPDEAELVLRRGDGSDPMFSGEPLEGRVPPEPDDEPSGWMSGEWSAGVPVDEFADAARTSSESGVEPPVSDSGPVQPSGGSVGERSGLQSRDGGATGRPAPEFESDLMPSKESPGGSDRPGAAEPSLRRDERLGAAPLNLRETRPGPTPVDKPQAGAHRHSPGVELARGSAVGSDSSDDGAHRRRLVGDVVPRSVRGPHRRRRWVRRIIIILGGALVMAGAMVLVYAYLLFPASDARTARFQRDLAREFALRQAGQVEVPIEAAHGQSAVVVVKDNPLMVFSDAEAGDPVTDSTLPAAVLEPAGVVTDLLPEDRPPQGDPAGQISAPSIGLDWVFVEGVSISDLERGPGHWSNTPMPGQPGNAVISGHRTTYGAPFGDLDSLVPGDPILVNTLLGTHTYEVVGTRIVHPSEVWVADQRDGAWLTLTTCHPRYSSQQRMIVFARLVYGPNAEAIADGFDGSYELPDPPEG